MKAMFKKVNWVTVVVAVLAIYLINQNETTSDLFSAKNKYFG
jgi:hypothetical protein